MYDRLINTMAGIGAIAILLMALWITYEVIMRYLLNAPTIWAGDLSEYTMLWGTFLAAPYLARQGGHVSVDTLTMRLTRRQQHWLGVVGAIIAALVSAVMLWQGADATLDAYTRGQIIARTWQVPRWVVWVSIPIGSFFLMIEFIRAAIRSARAARDELAFVHHATEETAL